MHKLPSEIEELSQEQLWELLEGFKLKAEHFEKARNK